MGPRVVALSLLLLGVTGTAVSATASQAVPPRQLQAGRAVDPPGVDGRLDDAIWAVTEPAGDFLQRDPVEGDPASEPSLVRIAYDDAALYGGARLFDREPSAIVRSPAATSSSRPTPSSSTWTRITIT